MIGQYYKAVEIDAEGNSVEPVNYVGVYTLNWKDRPLKPEIGFVEADVDIYALRELLNDLNYNIEINLQNGIDNIHITYLKNLWNKLSDWITKAEGV